MQDSSHKENPAGSSPWFKSLHFVIGLTRLSFCLKAHPNSASTEVSFCTAVFVFQALQRSIQLISNGANKNKILKQGVYLKTPTIRTLNAFSMCNISLFVWDSMRADCHREPFWLSVLQNLLVVEKGLLCTTLE